MEENMRKRGRARGRARGEGDRPPLRSGSGGHPTALKQAPAIEVKAGQHAIQSRGVVRGGGVSGAGDVTRAMSQLGVTRTRHEVMLSSRKNFDPAIFDPKTKPDHIGSKKGSGGRTINMYSNFFNLACSKDWILHQYRVDFDPEVDHLGARKGMVYDHKELFGKAFVFEGTMLFTGKLLHDKTTEVFSQRRSDGEKIRITITHTNELSPVSNVAIQLYNILFRGIMAQMGYKQIGQHYYNPEAGFTVECRRVNLELWPGFLTSIMQYENSVLLCAQVSHKLMRSDTVLDVMNQMYRESQRCGRNFKEEVMKFLIGQIILTRYNNKTYRIDGIEWDLNVGMTFDKRGEKISYAKYYKDQYNIIINDQKQPLLLSRPKKREIKRGSPEVLHLVPELCTVTGLTDDLRADFTTMKALAAHTKQPPTNRAVALVNFVKRMTSNVEIKEKLKKWGINFEENLLKLQGRVLDPEPILFGQQKVVNGGHEASWDRELRNCQLLKTVPLREWFLVHMARDDQFATDLIQKMCQVAKALGFMMARPTVLRINNDRTDQFQKAITNHLNANKGTQLVCCLLPSNRKDRYDAIKKLCCVDIPVPSQVVLSKTLAKPQRVMSIATKIVIQINCKLGGEAWGVRIPLRDCMLIGFDTYHDSSQAGRSVGGFVASVNSTYTRWYSNVTFQQTGGELTDGLVRCLKGALMRFREVNGKFPQRIIVFRDGVGDGQLDMVKGYEIPQLIECFKVAGDPEYKPNFSFVVVSKRVKPRFFAVGRGNDLNNPPPGTIVDDVVTRPNCYDFYVVSQSVREGAVSPTHFNVIYDTSSLKPEHMQKLSYKLCHLYYNWAGTVRVPAPCMYAHKLAFLVGQSVHRPVDHSLNDKLYFL